MRQVSSNKGENTIKMWVHDSISSGKWPTKHVHTHAHILTFFLHIQTYIHNNTLDCTHAQKHIHTNTHTHIRLSTHTHTYANTTMYIQKRTYTAFIMCEQARVPNTLNQPPYYVIDTEKYIKYTNDCVRTLLELRHSAFWKRSMRSCAPHVSIAHIITACNNEGEISWSFWNRELLIVNNGN